MTKKNKNKQKDNKWLYVILFLLPMVITVLMTPKLDNDLWYLLAEGREIIQNGIYSIDPLSMHEGFQVVVQNWASAASMYIIYSVFGTYGIYAIMLICNFLVCLLLYKICYLISDKNKILSLIIMFVCDITLCSYYIVTRPQVISFVILLLVIYLLELYIKRNDEKYLKYLPLISLIEVNLHASLWWMIFLFILPYVIDGIKIPFVNTQGYKIKPILKWSGIALLAGLINPYFYKAITFIFTSYGDKYMHVFINELLPFMFNKQLCKHMFVVMVAIGIIYTLFRSGNVRIRYICLFCGTLILGFMSVKGFSHFIIVSFFPLAYFFKDIFPEDFDELPKEYIKFLNYFITFFGVLTLAGFSFLYIRSFTKLKLTHDGDGAMEVLQTFDKETTAVYSSFNNGGYIEFYGYHPYIDPRAELYLKANNKKADIFEENYKLQHGQIDIDEFLDKYNFTHLFVESGDILYNLENNNKYIVIYENTDTGYRLYARRNIYSEEEAQELIDKYNTAVEKAKAEAAKEKEKETKN